MGVCGSTSPEETQSTYLRSNLRPIRFSYIQGDTNRKKHVTEWYHGRREAPLKKAS